MNKHSRVDTDARDAINLTRHQVNDWFNDNGCKEISSVEKPLDTSEHKRLCLDWVRNHITKLSSLLYYVAYLNEKFFYTTSRRRKLKQPPLENMREMDPIDLSGQRYCRNTIR